MNRSLRTSRFTVDGCGRGEILVATTFTDPERGVVRCASAPLLADWLLAGLAAACGRRVRLAAAGSPSAAGPQEGVMITASYLARDGHASGFAFAAHPDDTSAMEVAELGAQIWLRVLRTRRLLLARTAPLCQGGLQALALIRKAMLAGSGPVRVLGRPVAGRDDLNALAEAGVDFSPDPASVPAGCTVVIPAHGAPAAAQAALAARQAATPGGFRVLDGTCPLVAPVAHDAASYAQRGDLVVVIGRDGDVVVPVLAGGHSHGGAVAIVRDPGDVSLLSWPDGDRVSFVIDPAMPAREAMQVLAALRARFPALRGHHFEVMCPHGTDLAGTAAALGAESDWLLILAGDDPDPDAAALARAACAANGRCLVVRRLGDITPEVLAEATTIAMMSTLGSARDLASQVACSLAGLGPLTVAQRSVSTTAPGVPFPRVPEPDGGLAWTAAGRG